MLNNCAEEGVVVQHDLALSCSFKQDLLKLLDPCCMLVLYFHKLLSFWRVNHLKLATRFVENA